MTTPQFASAAEAQKAGWFSRRHQTRTEHEGAQLDYRINRGKMSRQERALKQRNEELTRYGEGDYLDNRGLSLVKANNPERRKDKKRRKKVRAAVDIENLERKLG